MLGTIVVYLSLAIILGVVTAWALSSRSDRRTTGGADAREAVDEAKLIPPAYSSAFRCRPGFR